VHIAATAQPDSPAPASPLPTDAPGAAGQFVGYHYHERPYKLYTPGSYRPDHPAPLLVMLHGCTQNPDDFAVGTQMNQYAEQAGWLVLYPQQTRRHNLRLCWNWFQERNQQRGQGEPALILGMLAQVSEQYAIDRERIYAAGISAGAAMALVLGATYPDIFAALGVCAAVPYKSATTVMEALRVMRRGASRQARLARQLYQAMGAQRRVVPLVLFHGTADEVVAPINAYQVLLQWWQANQLIDGPPGFAPGRALPVETLRRTAPGGRAYTLSTYANQDGTVLQHYMVDGMKHRWPGGSPLGSYTDPYGPPASALLLEFFRQHPRGGIAIQPQQLRRPVPQPATASGLAAAGSPATADQRGPRRGMRALLRRVGRRVVRVARRLWRRGG
jgi:poly(hydroxyalkanoate) depolymerase family esterase